MIEILRNHPLIFGVIAFVLVTFIGLYAGFSVVEYLKFHGRGETHLAYRIGEITLLGSPIAGMFTGIICAYGLSRTKNIFGWGLK